MAVRRLTGSRRVAERAPCLVAFRAQQDIAAERVWILPREQCSQCCERKMIWCHLLDEFERNQSSQDAMHGITIKTEQ